MDPELSLCTGSELLTAVWNPEVSTASGPGSQGKEDCSCELRHGMGWASYRGNGETLVQVRQWGRVQV